MKAFYLAIPHNQSDILWNYLCKYTQSDEKLILAKETSTKSHQDISGQHFHILAEWETKTYEAFKKTIIINHYKLRGQATKDHSRQYGIVRKIKDEDKMLSYTIKANDYQQQNYTEEELEEAYNNSYEKEDIKAYQDQIMEHLLANRTYFIKEFSENQGSIIQTILIEESILKYNMETKDKPICKSKLEYYTNYYLQCVEPLRYQQNYIQEILIYLKKRI